MASKKKQGVDTAYNNLSKIGKEKKEKEKREINFDMLEDMFSEEDVDSINTQFEEAEKKGVEFIDVEKLVPNRLNKWSMRRDESFKAIVKRMKEHGFEEAFIIVGEKRSDGNVDIISGERRWTIAKEIGIKKVPIAYKEFETDKDRLDFINLGNLTRRNTVSSLVHNYKLYSDMYDNGEISKEETSEFSKKADYIASKLGVSPTTMKSYLFLLGYDEKLWYLIDDKVISRSTLYTLHKDNESNKYTNFAEVLGEIVKNNVIFDLNVPLDERQKITKEILAKLKKKGQPGRKRSISKELQKMNSDIAGRIDKYDYPQTEKEKEKTISVIDELIANLTKIKEKL